MATEKPSLLKRLPAGLLGSAIEGLGAPASIAQTLLGLGNQAIEGLTGYENVLPNRLSIPFPSPAGLPLGQFLPSIIPPTSQEIKQRFVEPIAEATVGREALQPGSFPEQVLQRTAYNLPGLALSGGLSGAGVAATTLGRDLAGSTLSEAARELKLPAPVQLFAGIAGERGFNKLLNRISKSNVDPETLNEMAQQAKTQFYNKQQELGKNIEIPAKSVESTWTNLASKIKADKSLDKVDKTKLEEAVKILLEEDLTNGIIPANNLVATRTQLNSNIKNSYGNVKDYWKAMVKPVRSLIEEQKNDHRSWYDALKKGDSIEQALNFPDYFLGKAAEIPYLSKVLKNPLAYSLASMGPTLLFTKDPIKTLASGVGGGLIASGIKKGAELIGFMRSPEPFNLLIKASEQLMNNNIKGALSSYNKLNKSADNYEHEQQRVNEKMKKKRSKATANLVKVS